MGLGNYMKVILVAFVLASLFGCGNACEDDPQCAYETCLTVKQQMQEQGRNIDIRCVPPLR